jgi:purine/pyrimidine-nucleoside phosphorylase
MSKVPEQFVGVTAVTKANIYFNGSVVSHAIILPDGSKKTLGLIYPGKYHFNTEAPEKMEIISGQCKVLLDGNDKGHSYGPGDFFDVAGKSGFSIEVTKDICEYVCSFLST